MLCRHIDTKVTLVDGEEICVNCGWSDNSTFRIKKVPLRKVHKEILRDVMLKFPQSFNRITNHFLWFELWRYIYEKRVFRVSIKGETRGGKSELTQTIGINYYRIFNRLFELGHFDDIDVKGIKKEKIDFSIDNIHDNQSVYIDKIKSRARDDELVFGEFNIIDEDKESYGGLGSFSEQQDLTNINNIVARFMLSEAWIRPDAFLKRNTPYGIQVLIKDYENRLNWGLLFKVEMESLGIPEFTLLGWVAIGLHEDKDLRVKYEAKKDGWINEELKGGVSPRIRARHKASEVLADDERFCEGKVTKSGLVVFKRTPEQQKIILELLMGEGKIAVFNETEMERIVQHARIIKEKKLKI